MNRLKTLTRTRVERFVRWSCSRYNTYHKAQAVMMCMHHLLHGPNSRVLAPWGFSAKADPLVLDTGNFSARGNLGGWSIEADYARCELRDTGKLSTLRWVVGPDGTEYMLSWRVETRLNGKPHTLVLELKEPRYTEPWRLALIEASDDTWKALVRDIQHNVHHQDVRDTLTTFSRPSERVEVMHQIENAVMKEVFARGT